MFFFLLPLYLWPRWDVSFFFGKLYILFEGLNLLFLWPDLCAMVFPDYF